MSEIGYTGDGLERDTNGTSPNTVVRDNVVFSYTLENYLEILQPLEIVEIDLTREIRRPMFLGPYTK